MNENVASCVLCCVVLCCVVSQVNSEHEWAPSATLDLCACSLTVQDWPGRQTRFALVSARSLSPAEQSRGSTSCRVQPGPTALCAAQPVRTCQTLPNPSNWTFYDWSGCRGLWLSCRRTIKEEQLSLTRSDPTSHMIFQSVLIHVLSTLWVHLQLIPDLTQHGGFIRRQTSSCHRSRKR